MSEESSKPLRAVLPDYPTVGPMEVRSILCVQTVQTAVKMHARSLVAQR